MDYKTILEEEISLDPDDWEDVKDLGQRMVGDMVDYLRFISNEPVWRKPGAEMKEFLTRHLNDQGQDLETIYHQFKQHILPFPKGNIHPRFWSWVQGTGSLTAVFADMLASTMNSNVAIGDHAALYVEGQVIGWCKSMLGYAPESSGILLSGGSMANITGLIVARNNFDQRIRKEGIQVIGKPMIFYASEATHSCQQRAAEVMGLGSNALRRVPVDENYKMRIEVLKEMIKADLSAGLAPFAVVANVGTVNTGAIDPLEEIEKICLEFKLWFHVDGAFGALAKLIPEYEAQLKFIENADSLAFDLHKWMYLPYEIGCLLVKDKTKHRLSFAQQPEYLIRHERGLPAGPDPINNYGMELSRGFKALKAWFCFQEHGLEKYRRLIRQNIAQCKYLEAAILASPSLELMAPVELNIVCFRYTIPGMDPEDLNVLNKEILMRLHEQAVATPSYTFIKNNYTIRVANVNHRSKKTDFDALVAGVIRIGDQLRSER
ncbi:MAG: aminotransferase class V-fold PLP-dependent enzyme [Saprospiraceae bacterium]|nr:aminotransferase class V-fold PLP-dependent enzyme [Saprospiraceae bacterium]